MPALLVCVAITALAVLMTDPMPRNSIITGLSALFGVANIALFNFELDYFSPSSRLNAFTHTWSLGVEEQFYVVFPLFVWFTFLGSTKKSLNTFRMSLAVASLASMLLFLWLYEANQVAAYYLMPTRIWELGAGALVFVCASYLGGTRIRRIIGYLSPVALLALMLCFAAPQENAAWITLIAVALTTILLANSTQTLSSQFLSLPPVVYVGKVSYSLYLWHWPIVSLAPLVLDVSWRHSMLYLVAMSIAAVFSYHLVETPMRKAHWTNRKILDIGLGFSCCLILSVILLGTMLYKETTVGESQVTLYPESFLPLLGSGLPYMTCVVDDKRPMTAQTFEQCTIAPSTSGMPTIWAMGDSHVGHLQGLLHELHDLEGVGIHFVITPGRHFPASQGDEYPPRELIFNKVLENLKPGDLVLISRLYLERNGTAAPNSDIPIWIERVSRLAKELKEKQVWLAVASPPPMFTFEDVRECDISNRDFCSVERAGIARSSDKVLQQLRALEKDNSNVIVIDMFALVCPAPAKRCYPDDGTRFLYRDKDHFNSVGSQLLAQPIADLLQSTGVIR